MIIIISPSKTQDFSHQLNKPLTNPKYYKEAYELTDIIKQLSKKDLSEIMNIKGPLLDETFDNFQKFNKNTRNHAICSYTGSVFKEIKWKEYSDDELDFMNQHIRILSALYGMVKPFDGIKPYRLDMTMKLLNNSLHQYWSILNDEFKNDDLIVNLASIEFSKLIKTPMITIHFLDRKNKIYQNIGTYSKKARGLMVNYVIKNKIKDVNNLKLFNLDNYQFNEHLSNNHHIYFTR